jgi:hypothetical protein
LLRVKHRIDARTDPEKARQETIDWIKRLRDMRRLGETRALGVFLPPPPHDFVGRAETLEMLYGTLVENPGSALFLRRARLRKIDVRAQVCLPNARRVRCGRVSTLRPTSCRRHRGRARGEVHLGPETKPPQEQIARRQGMACQAPGSPCAGRCFGKRRGSAAPRSSGPVAMHGAPACASVDFAGSFDGMDNS